MAGETLQASGRIKPPLVGADMSVLRHRPPWIAVGSLALSSLALSIAWPLYVFAGSQVAFLIAVLASCLGAVTLALARTQLLLVYLVGLAALLGSEANGRIGSGSAPLGSARLIDLTVLASVGAIAVTAFRSRSAVPRNLRSAVRAFLPLPLLILLSLVLYATVLWAVNGAPRDSITRTDVRLILIAAAACVIVSICAESRWTLVAFVLLSVPLAAKAGAIYASDLITIGVYDRLQAVTTTVDGFRRVILIGGDTVLALAPAAGLCAVRTTKDRRLQGAIVAAVICAFGGVLLSGTRTTLVVSVVLVIIAAALTGYLARIGRRETGVAVIAVLVLFGALSHSGMVERLTKRDPAHVGINFRRDEAESFFRLPATHILLGEGVGARFVGKASSGQSVDSGWMHSFPLWILLKVGVPGLLVFLILSGLLVRVAWRAWHSALSINVIAGLIIVGGLLLASLTLNRAALPEGVLVMALGISLVTAGGRARPTATPPGWQR